MPTHGTFDVGISLAKGIIFRKIGLANGAISKLWAAHPCRKFSREPPPPRGLLKVCVWVLTHNYYVMLMIKEISLNSAFAVRPNSESSGLKVEVKLDFQY